MLFNRIKRSLVVQTNFLLLFSIVCIAALWIFFYFSQKHQQEEHDTARYFNTVTTIQPLLVANKKIDAANLRLLGMKLYNQPITNNHQVIFEKRNEQKGFRILTINYKRILHLFNQNAEIYLEDIYKDETTFLVHIVFLLLLLFQTTLYLRLTNALSPLALLSKKLKRLEKGDLSALEIDSRYDEIKQIKTSYNQSIAQIDYMLETREMFNKIFMHEMKMPLAKGMFYLKQEPSQKTHEKLQHILSSINDELEEFSQIESLISYQHNEDTTEHNFLDIFEIAKNRAMANIHNIKIIYTTPCKLKGDKEFWILCIKNLIDNALKYSIDGKLFIECDKEKGISFINKGEPLPVDISQEIPSWKIDKTKRHKSSTGYGFGLFIIKNIVTIHNYTLLYTYDEAKKELCLRISHDK